MPGETSSATPSPIQTVVVLVQESRSFDHMLGWIKTLNPEIDGVTGSESNPISTSDPTSTHATFKDTAAYVDPDSDHSFQAINEQVSGKPWDYKNPDPNPEIKMNGFAQNGERTKPGLSETVMSGFKPDMIPVFKQLVTEFAVCDRWFASLPTSTQSNRLYLHSATSHGAVSNNTEQIKKGYPQKTIFESLEENGYSFGIYHQAFPTTLFYRRLKYVDNFHQFDLRLKHDCKHGKLPNYVARSLSNEIYEALRSSPQWNEMSFLITYVEHGGFYDHVPTPTGVPSPDDIVSAEPLNFKFDRLDCRVPAIMVSPWIEPGTVLHRPSGPHPTSEFEHSSITATVKKILNLKEFLIKRGPWAGPFDIAVNGSTPRTDCPVQVAAAFKGEGLKLVENMDVSSGFKYVEDAFKKFYDDGQKAKEMNGFEGTVTADASTGRRKAPKTSV
ncbi:Non-specific phospholipase C3 [Hibiscus syriacus]|uniref:Non-specific phospholipase C3 n=1 Tax=Hibiscus syriacus TaxID=106335 RepID=A0A6A3BE17_HIBSY|nr:Non-specific phospholipase C3 [Hibiscus syriacus]